VKPLAPQASVSTNSTTPAYGYNPIFDICTIAI